MTEDQITDAEAAALERALELAGQGLGRVDPNPIVGAVVIDRADGSILGDGFHERYGDRHAEPAALADCRARGNDPAGATVCVTLEPCDHTGKQPPCSEALIAAGVGRVVIGTDDPSSKAAGKGPQRLRDAGIEVVFAAGDLAERSALAIQPFRKHSMTGRPHVIFKAAMTLDGRTATASGDSRWISGEASRALVHQWRSAVGAIAVGINTVLADDPLLTVRLDPMPDDVRQPVRVVFDTRARLPIDSALVRSLDQAPVFAVVSAFAAADRREQLAAAGVELIEVATPDGDPLGSDQIVDALDVLGQRGIRSMILEGGATIAGAFFEVGEIDEMRTFVAPIVLGENDASPLLEPPLAVERGAEDATAGSDPVHFAEAADQDQPVRLMADALRPESVTWEAVGDDMLARARLRSW